MHGFFERDDHVRDFDEFLVFFAGQFLHAAKSVLLIEAGPLHQNALGAFDDFAISQRLPQPHRLQPQGLELLEPPNRQGNGWLVVVQIVDVEQNRNNLRGLAEQVPLSTARVANSGMLMELRRYRTSQRRLRSKDMRTPRNTWHVSIFFRNFIFF